VRRFAAALAAVIVACGGTAAPSPTPTRAAIATTAAPRTPSPTAACATATQSGPATRAIVELANGRSFTIQLRADKAPNTVANFAKNSRECRYDNLTFHRVELNPPFVIQGGDPLGTGSGGGTQPTELSDLPFVKGAVGIARGGNIQVSNGMQFFVCIGSCRHLDNLYTNFGTVVSGQEVADAVRVGDRIRTIRIE
jgi:cyclophilin family peptidyl-prolyl cis-trans isomerase